MTITLTTDRAQKDACIQLLAPGPHSIKEGSSSFRNYDL